jgi:hypothetical protein
MQLNTVAFDPLGKFIVSIGLKHLKYWRIDDLELDKVC